MPKFDAGAVVEGLDYEFAPYVKARGVIPEPTDELIGDFLGNMKKIAADIRKSAGIEDADGEDQIQDPMQVIQALDNLDARVFTDMLAKMNQLYATLCQNKPSAEDIGGLPLRARLKFFAWIGREVFNPEAGTGAGNVVAMTPPRAAAG